MNRKRLVIGIGLFVAAIAATTCVRYCLRAMRQHGVGQRRAWETRRRAARVGSRDRDRDQQAAALAA
jgi:hypothetical protein